MSLRKLSLIALCVAPLMLLRVYGQLDDANVWRPVHIVAGGYVPGFVAHPTAQGLIYARTDIGSVYRWNTHNGQWSPLTDFQTPANYNRNGPESIALDPTDPTRLYIAAGMYACGGCGLRHSVDGGITWTSFSNVSWANSVAVGAPAA